MRRKYFGLAIAAIAAFGPTQAWGGDREIAEQIIERLKDNRDSGALKGFTLDMKVDEGVVLFRGNVTGETQKNLVLGAARNIDGIANVVDELTIKTTEPVAKTEPAATVETTAPAEDFSLRQALAEEAQLLMAEETETKPVTLATTPLGAQPVVPGEVRPTAAIELAAPMPSKDQQVVQGVVSALGKAQREGTLKGFGVETTCEDGVVWLRGRAASSAQRNRILQIANATPGVKNIRNSIKIPSQIAQQTAQQAPQALPQLPQPPALSQAPAMPANSRLAPVAVDRVSQPARQSNRTPAAMVAAPMGIPAQAAPYRSPQMAQPLRAQPVQAQMGMPMQNAPMMGQPVPMGPGGGVGAPRYDSPNLPNYAWPGYAAHPNYAALSYPQQYSPSAFPYIGPFYPYPQVPMGWRKVTLEWDDGWWNLDFTDR